MRNVTRKFVVAAAGVMMTATAASAQNLLNFGGSAFLQDQPGNPTNLFIDFLAGPSKDIAGTTGGTIETVAISNFPGTAPGQLGTIQDLIIGPSGVTNLSTGNGTTGASIASAPVFVTISGLNFTITGASTGGTFGYGITLTPTAFGTSATLGVTGTVSGAGIAAGTLYNGLFTAQFVGQTPEQVFTAINSGATVPVSFSATFASSTVPEPSTYLLLASGIGALGMIARRRRSQV